jgi:hypothetical protein
MRGLQLVDSWSSRPGEPFAGLSKCFEGAGQKEVSCAGLREQDPRAKPLNVKSVAAFKWASLANRCDHLV